MPSLQPLVSDAASRHVYNNINLQASAIALAAFAYQQFVKQTQQLNYIETANKAVLGAFAAVAFATTMQLVKQLRDTVAGEQAEIDSTKVERISRGATHGAFLGAAGLAAYAHFTNQNLLNLPTGLHVAVLSTLVGGLASLSINTFVNMRKEDAPSKLQTVPTLAAAVAGLAFVGFNLFNLEDKGFKASGRLSNALGYEGLTAAGLFVAASLVQYVPGLVNAAGACVGRVGSGLSTARDVMFKPGAVSPAGTPTLRDPLLDHQPDTVVEVDDRRDSQASGSPAPRPAGSLMNV
ncbi:MAG: hypothetical protein P1U40_01595 [Coxiellaceae bacterium]|nr:hypothetical protein [Coxiellaceae bacterium]